MPTSLEEDKTNYMSYPKRNPDPSLNFREVVPFNKSEKAFNNEIMCANNFYRVLTGRKTMPKHIQRYKLFKLSMYKRVNLAHLKYIKEQKDQSKFECSTDGNTKDSQLQVIQYPLERMIGIEKEY
jgi:hypothetical protein